MRIKHTLLLMLCLILMSLSAAAEEGYTVTTSKAFTLHPYQKGGNPYSVVIPLELEYTGKVRLSMDVEKIGNKKLKTHSKNGTFRFILLDPEYKKHANGNKFPKKYILKQVQGFDHQKLIFEYYIDEAELARLGGKYDLMISNFSNGDFKGEYYLRYPGSKEAAEKSRTTPQGNHPDLAVSSIKLDDQNRVVVTVANLGKKGVPKKIYKVKDKGACNLNISINGKFWGGAGIMLFDPDKKLTEKRQSVRYVLKNLKISKRTKITAEITKSRMKERSTDNNIRTAMLEPGAGTGKYDLAVTQVALNRQKQIVVTVVNTGQSKLPPGLWKASGTKACTLNLKINGKQWGGVSLKGLDPQKRLTKPGGQAVYINKSYKVNDRVRVTATIDALSTFAETNEKNNRKTVRLDP